MMEANARPLSRAKRGQIAFFRHWTFDCVRGMPAVISVALETVWGTS